MTALALSELLLPLLVFSGAALQVAGGMGFGVVAGPILVATVGATAGIQAAVILNIGVALFGWILGKKYVRYDILIPMVPGLVIGILIGVASAALVPEWIIKAGLCISLGFICFLPTRSEHPNDSQPFRLSLTSGTMGGALAIPGPAAAVYLRHAIPSTVEMRSSMMPLLTFSYIVTGFALLFTQGLNQNALAICISNGPIAIAGIIAGLFAANRLSDLTLRRLTQLILYATLANLTFTTIQDLLVQFE